MDMIETKALEFAYPAEEGEKPVLALRGVDTAIEKGSFVVVLGHNGSGKSTFAKSLNAILLPCGGKVYVEGMDTQDEACLLEIRRRVGMVFQNPDNQIVANVVEEDVAFAPENLGVASEEIRRRVDDALAAVDMTAFMTHAPHLLSGGQKQRVAIARALATDPKVLLCDEATSALDPTTTNSILALLKELNQKLGVTVVIITHQMSVIEEICTRVAILDGGEVAEEGRVEDIFAHPATDAARRLVYPGGVSAKQYPAGTRAVRVSFNGGTVYDPLIASLAIECGVKVNILGADTRNIDGKAFGTMLLLLPDDPNEAAKALSYIRSQPNITAEEVEYHA